MRMQITVDNLTTNKALAILSALETAEALHETDIHVDVLPISRSERLSLSVTETGTPETDESAETDEVVEAVEAEPVKTTVEAATWLDPTTGKRHKKPGYQPRPRVGLPVIGSRRTSRLIPLVAATDMLGWGPGRLAYLINTGAIETVAAPHGAVRYHYLTPEQIDILRSASGRRQRFSRTYLRQATEFWLATHPRHREESLPLSA